MENAQSIDGNRKYRVALIAALTTKTRALGKNGELLWHPPEDMQRFKALTMGHPVIMGRKTWESLPEKYRPLPGRTNIVVTRQNDYAAAGATVVNSLEAAVACASATPGSEEVFVIGGGEIYTAALPYADRLYLTLFDADSEGDAFFPPYESEFTKVISDESREWNGLHYRWTTFER